MKNHGQNEYVWEITANCIRSIELAIVAHQKILRDKLIWLLTAHPTWNNSQTNQCFQLVPLNMLMQNNHFVYCAVCTPAVCIVPA